MFWELKVKAGVRSIQETPILAVRVRAEAIFEREKLDNYTPAAGSMGCFESILKHCSIWLR
jgi:hypothetical protein